MKKVNGNQNWPSIYNGTRHIGGTAAGIHMISENGGWESHHEKFLRQADDYRGITRSVLNDLNKDLQKPKIV